MRGPKRPPNLGAGGFLACSGFNFDYEIYTQPPPGGAVHTASHSGEAGIRVRYGGQKPNASEGDTGGHKARPYLAWRWVRIVAVAVAFSDLALPIVDEQLGTVVDRDLSPGLHRFRLGLVN